MIRLAETNPNVVTLKREDIIDHISKGLFADPNNSYDFISKIESAASSLVKHGMKIQAIQLIKTCFPMSLKEAKDYVESVYTCKE